MQHVKQMTEMSQQKKNRIQPCSELRQHIWKCLRFGTKAINHKVSPHS